METNYVKIVSEVVSACAEKYSDIKRVNGPVKENFSDSWMCNMYMDWLEYVEMDTFVREEILSIRPRWTSLHDAYKVGCNLIDLFRSIGTLQPMLTHEQIGFIAERVLKGEI